MAITAAATSFDLTAAFLHRPNHRSPTVSTFFVDVTAKSSAFPRLTSANVTKANRRSYTHLIAFASGGGNDSNGGSGSGGGGGGGGGEGGGENESKDAALFALAQIGRSLDSLPKDLAMAIESGRIPVEIVMRYLEMEKSPLKRWLLQFGPIKERLLADDLFLAKLAMECGVGVFTKTAAEYERRRGDFFNELEVVFADVVMGIIADFMLVYLPAPTVALRPALGVNAGSIFNFLQSCPDNAFQVELGHVSYTPLHRIGAIVRNGAMLFGVGTTSSLVGTAITNAFMNAKKVVNKSSTEEVENLPVLSTSAAYGVYMAVSSNLRYQIIAGVVEQRILEPMLHNHKIVLSAMCFAIRTGNTFLGSLLWVDYARWVGIQKSHED
ncbi:hypothetical protein V2J09_018506 [Rumex salicifolius]